MIGTARVGGRKYAYHRVFSKIKIGSWAPPVFVIAILTILIGLPIGAFILQAISPRLFGQGSSYFTLASFGSVLKGITFRAFADSLIVSILSSIITLVLAFPCAWLVNRTNIYFRRLWPILMWALLLIPTYMTADGWQYLFEPSGVLQRLRIPHSFVYGIIFSPVGVILVLSLSALPFSFFVLSSSVNGVGQELEDAIRLFGGRSFQVFKMLFLIMMPAILSSLAITFAESMSDFGVASTLAFYSHFPMATFQLFNSINNFPPNFGTAAGIGALLMLCAVIPIFVQSRALKSRSYATLSGRTVRPKRVYFKRSTRIFATGFLATVFLFGIAIPVFGAIVASMLPSFGNGTSLKLNFTFANYTHLFKGSYINPVFLSGKLSFITAGITVIMGVIMARLLVTKRRSKISKGVDLALLGSMALPGIVLAAGYIFSFNLPITAKLGIDLYETIPLLIMGYIATALPSQTRLLVAPISQFKDSMIESSKVHGNGNFRSWIKIGFPLMSKTLMWAWVLTFVKTFTELPVSQILYPPGQEPISVAISNLLSGYHYDLATALTVISLVEVLLFIVIVTVTYSLLTPKGWRRISNTAKTT